MITNQYARLSDALNPTATGPPASRWRGGGHIVAFLYFCDDIFATGKDIEEKLCTHPSEYLAKVLSKFGVDLI